MLMQYFDTEEIELDINIDNKFTQKLHKSIHFADITAKFRASFFLGLPFTPLLERGKCWGKSNLRRAGYKL